MDRIIFHVDMDAFFVSVEIRKNKKLKGKPVVVGADPKQGKGRGVVSTCSYEARKYGIKSGMPISQAYKLCPHAIFRPVHMGFYKEASRRVMNILRKYSNIFEQVSIDEAFMNMSKRVSNFSEAKQRALEIKKEIKNKESITCSIGIASNKLVAKIASDYDKPEGLTIVKPEGVKQFLFPLQVKKLYGVGPKTNKILKEELNIETISDLARYDKSKLIDRFGKMGIQLHFYANGIDNSPVTNRKKIKSIGREHTFDRNTNNRREIYEALEKIAKQVYEDIKLQDFSFRTVIVKVRYSNFDTHTKQTTFSSYTQDPNTIKQKSKELVKNFLNGKPIRLLGIRVTKLKPRDKTLEDF